MVERAWQRHTVVLLGGGPSLTAGDGLRRLARKVDREGNPLAIVAVNNAYQVAPQADVLYYADGRWYSWHKDLPEFQAFAGLRCTVEGSEGEGMEPQAHVLRCDVLSDYSRDPERLGHGGNGGHQALNLAALAGSRRIILLGYDMQYKAGRANWHKDHKIKAAPERRVSQWIPRFRELVAELERDGIDVINASERTALDCFRRQPIAELLPDPVE